MASFFRFASRTVPSMAVTALATAASTSSRLFESPSSSEGKVTYCEAAAAASPAPSSSSQQQDEAEKTKGKKKKSSRSSSSSTAGATPMLPSYSKPGFQKDAEGYFFNMIPNSQLYQPKHPYPYWDGNWDDKEPTPSDNPVLDRRKRRYLRKYGVTRHIILIRHGQYDESSKEDEKRILTDMGRQQAHETGKRLAQMLHGKSATSTTSTTNTDYDDDDDDDDDDTTTDNNNNNNIHPCNIKVVRVSNLTRAKETADIIASHISSVERSEPDPLLNEGRPAHTVPSGGKIENETTIQKTQEGHERIEQAYQNLFFRAPEIQYPPDEMFFLEDEETNKPIPPPPPPVDDETGLPPERHEYEIIVCHANVIRYFLCRALQLPPEAWLRLCTFNCSLTYLTIRPTGGVSCRMLGDVGHLPPELISFSGHHGFNW